MYPKLFSIPIPEFLQGFLPAQIDIYAYGFLIALGALLTYFYMSKQLKARFNIPTEQTQNLLIALIIGGVVGGKLFFYFEDPSHYFGEPKNMLKNFGGGFVFYGSLIFDILIVLWFIRKHKIPVMQMLDIIAIATCLVHGVGRIGCFMAGCCHGLPHDGIFSVVFTDPVCLAKPLNTPLHPTQLYSAGMIFGILLILLLVKRIQKFEGQLFLVYIVLYAIGRSFIETLRGDYKRGYIIEGILTHSQFISILMILVVGLGYFWFWRKNKNLES